MPLNLDAIRARAAELASHPGPHVALRYRSAYDWMMGNAEHLDARFRADYAKTDALAAELTRRGAVVLGVLYERKAYRDWLNDREDSREARLEWARGQIATPGPGVWTFALDGEEQLERAHADVLAEYGAGAGWAEYKAEGAKA